MRNGFVFLPWKVETLARRRPIRRLNYLTLTSQPILNLHR